MTETPEPTPAAESAAPPAPDAAEAPDTDDAAFDPRARDALAKLRRENHNLRTRLRDAEDQVGVAAARLGAHHRAVTEAAAKAAGLIDGSDIWSAQPDQNAFLDEFNDVIPDRVAEATRALLETKPYLGRPVGTPPSDRPIEGLRPGARAEEKPVAPTWHSALHGG